MYAHSRRRLFVPSSQLPPVSDVMRIAESCVEPIVELTTRLSEVAAPTNDEAARAAAVKEELERLGYEDVAEDDIHNVTGRIAGKDSSKCLLLAAHIDTVFPKDVKLTVTRDGDVLRGPGVGDNTVSVASAATVIDAFRQLGIVPAIDIIVTGNVGEEGLGDLRGMRAVVDSLPNIGGAIAIEGHSRGRITHRAVGSRRLRVTVTGPGGHSWGHAGLPSAIHHLAKIVARLDDIPLTDDPKTSFNAGLFDGGISVNTIAPSAVAVLDMRSPDAEALADLVSEVERVIAMPTPDGIEVNVEVVGDRPAGGLPRNRGLVPIASKALSELGLEVTYDESSTDANIPISRGIPSICIGLTTGGNVHRVDEYIDIPPLAKGFAQLLLTTIRSAQAIGRGQL
jgi:acetylornithine deacetylase/succinyl-diaminopimelate desuccinylase-like protein